MQIRDDPNIGSRYMAAPQLFYFAPKNKWFLVFQQGPPAYSTADDPTKPQTWSTPTNFFAGDPPVVTQRGHGWLDFFVTCDTANCYLFGADDAGDIFRSQTTLANFPNGFGNTVVVLHDDNAGNVFEGTAVYKVKGFNTYLMLVEGFDASGKRIYRAWTSNSLAGSWTPYLTSGTNPFAGLASTTFPTGSGHHPGMGQSSGKAESLPRQLDDGTAAGPVPVGRLCKPCRSPVSRVRTYRSPRPRSLSGLAYSQVRRRGRGRQANSRTPKAATPATSQAT